MVAQKTEGWVGFIWVCKVLKGTKRGVHGAVKAAWSVSLLVVKTSLGVKPGKCPGEVHEGGGGAEGVGDDRDGERAVPPQGAVR